MSNLSRISQLTGFSDPIYAEAFVKMHGFDIMLGTYVIYLKALFSHRF
jgi:coatomer subunit beta